MAINLEVIYYNLSVLSLIISFTNILKFLYYLLFSVLFQVITIYSYLSQASSFNSHSAGFLRK